MNAPIIKRQFEKAFIFRDAQKMESEYSNKSFSDMKKKGVVWISTVLYVLIGLAVMGLLLAALRPKIAETRDNFIISRTVQSFNTLDDTILRVREATGNKRSYIITLDQGYLTIDANNETISWQMNSYYRQSEPNQIIRDGRVDTLTVPFGKQWDVTLSLDYSNEPVNFTIDEKEGSRTLSKASLPYTIWIENKGMIAKVQQIDFKIE